MGVITLKQRVAKRIKFTVTDSDDEPVPLATATCNFVLKKTKDDAAYLLEIVDGSMDKTEATDGVVYVPLTATDTDQNPGSYVGELELIFSAADKDYSSDVDIEIEKTAHNAA